MKNILVVLTLLIVSGCASTTKMAMNPDVMQLIAKVSEKAPEGVKGEFEFFIKATGQTKAGLFLNSELDYRDRRNVTIAVSPKVASKIKRDFGVSAQDYFLNKNIRVKGEAKREKIWFYANRKRTKSYYYQIHISVDSFEQIEVIG